MTKHSMKIFLSALLMLMALAVLGGCFGRKHITSTPPGGKAGTRVGATAATEPAPVKAVEKEPVIIEKTYVVDAAKEPGKDVAKVKEGDLAAEPMAKSAKEADPKAAAEMQKELTKAEAVAVAPKGEMFYIQVGAFSELENANKVLAQLIEDGYKGSKLSMTDGGDFRVQAGAFTDKDSAREALDKLMKDFPDGFILKGVPEK